MRVRQILVALLCAFCFGASVAYRSDVGHGFVAGLFIFVGSVLLITVGNAVHGLFRATSTDV